LAAENVRHTGRKVSTRPTTLLQTANQLELCSESYKASKSRESRWAGFRESRAGVPGIPGQNVHLDATPATCRRVYYREYGGGILLSPGCGVSK
jgi:hypothetical protein